jgi:hypothetical protein
MRRSEANTMPRFRFKLKWMMVAVAIVAMTIAAARSLIHLAKRSNAYADQAAFHAASEARTLAMLAQTEKERARCKDPTAVWERWSRSGLDESSLDLFVRDDAEPTRRAVVLRRMASFHTEMRRRFESAIWRPWQIVVVNPMPGWDP